MSVCVKLSAIRDGMELLTDEMSSYLNYKAWRIHVWMKKY